jgi:glycosyltransferase involved in cell wall biosynthesis
MTGNYRVLIFVPSFSSAGGIGHYYEIIKKHLSISYDYFKRGVRNQHSCISRTVFPVVQIFDIFRLFYLLSFERFNVVLFNTSFGLTGIIRDSIFIVIARLFRKKYIVFFRGIDLNVIHKIEKKYWFIFKLTYLKADSIWVLSSKLKKRIIKWGYKGEIIIESTVVDAELMKDFQLNQLAEKYQNIHEFEILFLSRIEREKGIYESIEAFKIIHKKYPFTRLRICGDGSDTAGMLDYIRMNRLTHIYYEGFVKGIRKAEILSKAHLFLFPSYAEGLPNALLEAVAFGIPVITSDVGGIPDIFKNGTMGFMTKSTEPLVLADLIEKLILNPALCKDMGSYNYQYARENFYAETVAKRIESQLSKVLNAE